MLQLTAAAERETTPALVIQQVVAISDFSTIRPHHHELSAVPQQRSRGQRRHASTFSIVKSPQITRSAHVLDVWCTAFPSSIFANATTPSPPPPRRAAMPAAAALCSPRRTQQTGGALRSRYAALLGWHSAGAVRRRRRRGGREEREREGGRGRRRGGSSKEVEMGGGVCVIAALARDGCFRQPQ
jgi:hypothetical protein